MNTDIDQMNTDAKSQRFWVQLTPPQVKVGPRNQRNTNDICDSLYLNFANEYMQVLSVVLYFSIVFVTCSSFESLE